MMRKNYRKLSPKGKRITAGAASMLLGTGLMMSAHARPVKAMSSREDEISEVESVNVLSTEKAKVSNRVVQKESDTNVEGSTNAEVAAYAMEEDVQDAGEQTVDVKAAEPTAVVANDNEASATATTTEGKAVAPVSGDAITVTNKNEDTTKKTTYQDAVDEVDKINQENDKKLQDAINDAKDQGVNVEITDPKKIFTTVGDIDKNAEVLSKYTDNEINNIQEKLNIFTEELKKYNGDRVKYEQAVKDYATYLKSLGLLGEDETIDPTSKLGQMLVLSSEEKPYSYTVLNDKLLLEDLVYPPDDPWSSSHKPTTEFDLQHNYYTFTNIDGDFLIVNYHAGSSAYYGDRKISRYEVTYSDFVVNANESRNYLRIFANDTRLIGWSAADAKELSMTVRLYDEEDKLITLDENTAFVDVYTANNWIKTELLSDGKGQNDLYSISGDQVKIKFIKYKATDIACGFSTAWLKHNLNFDTPKPDYPKITVTPGQLVLNPNSSVNVHYVDVNDVSGTEYTPDSGEIKFTQTIDNLAVGDEYKNTLWGFEKEGYVLATETIDPNTESGVITDNTTDYYIYLKHGQSEKVVEEKDVTRVIHYVYDKASGGGEAAKDSTETIHFQHKALVDNITDDIVLDHGWTAQDSSDEFGSVDSPVIEGYRADKTTAGSHKVDADDLKSESPIKETVTYSELAEFHIHYVDVHDAYKNGKHDFTPEDGKEWTEHEAVFTDLVVGQKYPHDVISAAYGGVWNWNNEGYSLLGSANVDWMIKLRDDTVQSGTEHIYVYLIHATRPEVFEESDVTRVIHYVYDEENGGGKAAEDHVETIHFYHEKFVDVITGEIEDDGGWHAHGLPWKFDSVTSPVINGFCADKESIGELIVDSNPFSFIKGQVIEETVTYGNPVRSQEVDRVIHYVDADGNKVAEDQVITLKFTQKGTPSEANPNIVNWDGEWEPDTTAIFNAIDAKDVKIDWYSANNGLEELLVKVTNDDFNTFGKKRVIDENIVCSLNETKEINHEQKVELVVHYQVDGENTGNDVFNFNFIKKGIQDTINSELIRWTEDWTLLNPEILDMIKVPEKDWYSADKDKIDISIITVTDEDYTKYGEIGKSKVITETVTYTKNPITKIHRDQTVNLVIHYQKEDSSEAAEDQTITLNFKQTGIQDSKNKKLFNWNGTWTLTNPEIFTQLNIPAVDWYTATNIPSVNVFEMTDAKYQKDTPLTENVTVKYVANKTTNIDRKQEVDLVINYETTDGSEAPESQTIKLTFTQTGIQDSVNTNLKNWTGEWTLVENETLKNFNLSTIDWYHATNNLDLAALKVTSDNSDPIIQTITYAPNATANIHREQEVDLVINYKTTDNSEAPASQTIKLIFTQSGVQDSVNTDLKNWTGEWVLLENDELKNYKLPTLDWYHATTNLDISALKVTSENSAPLTQTIIYTKNDTVLDQREQTVKRVIHYIYNGEGDVPQDQEFILTFVQIGIRDTENPELVKWTGKWVPKTTDTFAAVTNPTIKGYHTKDEVGKVIVTVTDDGVNNPQVITENVTYVKNETKPYSENKTITQTIHYEYEDGTKASEDKVVTLVFNRTGIKDQVTGDVTWEKDWILTKTFETVVSPIIDGYTADKKEIEAYVVTVNNGNFDEKQDEEFTVTYTKNPVTPDPDDPTPDTPTPDLTPDDDEEIATPPLPEDEIGNYPSQSDEDNEEERTAPHAIGKETRSGTNKNNARVISLENAVSDDSVTPENVSTEATDKTDEKQATVNSTNEKTLPATGEEKDDFAKVMSGLADALGITGLAVTSKRRKATAKRSKKDKKER